MEPNDKASGTPNMGPSKGTRLDDAIARQVAARRATKPRFAFDIEKADPRWPIDLTPAIVDRTEGPTQGGTRDALAALEKSYLALAETYNTVTPDQRTAWHAKAEPASTAAVRAASRQLQSLDSALVLFENQIDDALKDTKTASVAAELRAVVRSEKVPLTELFSADFATVSAVLAAPPRLSGLTADQHAQLREIAAKTFAPEQHARRAAAQAHKAKVTRALQLYTERIGALLDVASPKRLNAVLDKIGGA